ncbi:MAG: hypothetical protein NVV69_16285 [Methyloversatilis sp.]|jgi:hypothetical protein|uniref:hypothetical protein n=1 Tax=Methyloversatilis sp. TaxID=2569862 RepID=UPI0025E28A88|nr:hypothetical protein [Methyloversatilis sp.]MCR6667525.1 hypothetical protein [Methyloversatilis sp.]
MNDFIPLAALLLLVGYVIAPGAVLWLLALYGALCEALWRLPGSLLRSTARLTHRVHFFFRRIGVR